MLKQAAELLRTQEWIRVYEALDPHGNEVSPKSEEACAFCLIGALYRVAPDPDAYQEALRQVAKAILPHISPNFAPLDRLERICWKFNDKGGQTKEGVIELLESIK